MPTVTSPRAVRHLLGSVCAAALLVASVSLPPSFAAPAAPVSVLLDNVPVNALQSLAIDLVQLRDDQRAQLAAAHDPARIEAYDERLGNLRQRIARHAGYVQASAPQGEQARQFALVQQQLGQYLAQHRQANRALHDGDLQSAQALSLGHAGDTRHLLWTELQTLQQSVASVGNTQRN
ncbi:hypothetical protein QSH46_011690 [Xanthomonas arboricola pv. juglandis]|uniref:hypothetical protein n=1 Tax=Xanthomonas arboricola TaxID=56448 RepID=UPI00063E882F|nr:hypothetical protein [Xanthomonas arboricola]MDN0220499.1 hypothetical protein [Xanthomonas arboricola pv. juglandis]MDN0225954.1 hypothetical protein [Xanthomonas arboricola pv. juglandis]MDN0228829.1 hypothetical protein [Xanthomonas arboricola pv. juglandis]MDN0233129.1 hypothetical protein [Xanthomonas arboricola pv. juglandis]MDN0237672.1 hypothetical protein [Xanthomonas arboricola pv. juglandis]